MVHKGTVAMRDGVHPTVEGYRFRAWVTQAAVQRGCYVDSQVRRTSVRRYGASPALNAASTTRTLTFTPSRRRGNCRRIRRERSVTSKLWARPMFWRVQRLRVDRVVRALVARHG